MTTALALVAAEPAHGTTEFCGPICDELIAHNRKHHSVIVAHVHGLIDNGSGTEPMSRAEAWSLYYKAKGPAAEAAVSRALCDAKSPAPECLVWHQAARDRAAVTWGEELRELERQQARANFYDIVQVQEPGSDAFDKLFRIYDEGIESKNAKGETVYRPATPHELQRAINDAASFRLKMPEDGLTYEQQMMVEGATYDSRGSIKVDLGRRAARNHSAKLEGLAPDLVKVTHEVHVTGERQGQAVHGGSRAYLVRERGITDEAELKAELGKLLGWIHRWYQALEAGTVEELEGEVASRL